MGHVNNMGDTLVDNTVEDAVDNVPGDVVEKPVDGRWTNVVAAVPTGHVPSPGVPHTTPEFVNGAGLGASLADRLARPASSRSKPS